MTARSDSTTPQTHKKKRLRPWLVLFAVGLVWKLLVITVGTALPKWLIDDGVEAQPDSLRAYARSAKDIAFKVFTNPIERVGIVQDVRVMDITRVAADSTDACGGLRARVRVYSYFNLPYSEVRTTCAQGVIAYRLIPRR